MQSLPIADYNQLLLAKEQKLTSLLSPFNAPKLDVFPSPKDHFRMRAEFRIWHEGENFFHTMFDKKTRRPYPVHEFPIASQLINKMMQVLLPLLKEQEVLYKRLFQIDYLSTLSNKIIVSLLYHKQLTEEWQATAEELKQKLMQLGFDVQLIGRASKQKICLEQDFVDEVLPVQGRNYIYRQVENSFTQPNAQVNCKMLDWAVDCTKGCRGDLLELYCGNGNFSIALAQNFKKVLATEIAKPSVNAAQFNIEANHIDNLQIIRMSAEDFTQAMNGVRAFNRLSHVDLKEYDCQTIFVDPPRAGLDDATVKLVQNYDRILYISCNPHTLCNNLETLCQTHRIEKAALFDQFPYTDHMEAGVWLCKK